MKNFCKIGFVEMFAGLSVPMGYVSCNGQHLDKVKYANLYSVIGDDFTPSTHTDNFTFCVPNYEGRSPLGMSNNYILGQEGGQKDVVLGINHLPSHNHDLNADSAQGSVNTPSGSLLSNTSAFDNEYSISNSPDVKLSNTSIGHTGDNQAHNNMHPYLSINFIIYTGL